MISCASRKRIIRALAPRAEGRGGWRKFRLRVAALRDDELEEAWQLERLDRNRMSVLTQISAERARRGMEERRERGGGPRFKLRGA